MDKRASFNIAIAGDITPLSDKELLNKRIKSVLSVLKEELTDTGMEITFITASRVYTPFWQELTEKSGYRVIVADAVFDSGKKTRNTDVMVSLLRNITEPADIMLMLWDENTESQNGIPWEMLKISHSKDVPCIWFDVKNGRPHWAQQVYYGRYSREKIRGYISRIHSDLCEYDDIDDNSRKAHVMKIGSKLQNHFLRKFNAQNIKINPKTDSVMQDEYSYSDNSKERDSLRKSLRKSFFEYDSKAIKYSERYTSSIYLRCVLPLISVVLTAIGFYGEAVLGFIFDIKISGLSMWAFVGAMGFGLYLIMNIAVYFLSKSSTINNWHSRFIENRIVAEVLRVMVHFLPSGIYVDASHVFGRYDNMTDQEKTACSNIHRILRSNDICVTDFTEKGKKEILQNANELIDDQIFYLCKTRNRYANVLKHLKRSGKVMFIVSSVFLIIRTIFQMAYSLNAFSFLGEMSSLSSGSGSALSFTTGMMNVLAMILPAWGSLYLTKLQLLNFESLYNTYEAKEERLISMKHRITELQNRRDVPVSTIYDVADELIEVLLSETKTWGNSVRQKKFTKL